MNSELSRTAPTANPFEQDSSGLGTRERLVAAALAAFIENGYSARVHDIARLAGFTSGAVYVHFPSRADLLDEAIASEAARLIDLCSSAPVDVVLDRAAAQVVLEGLALLGRKNDPLVRAALDRLGVSVDAAHDGSSSADFYGAIARRALSAT